jgi:hypothetical protein
VAFLDKGENLHREKALSRDGAYHHKRHHADQEAYLDVDQSASVLWEEVLCHFLPTMV